MGLKGLMKTGAVSGRRRRGGKCEGDRARDRLEKGSGVEGRGGAWRDVVGRGVEMSRTQLLVPYLAS